jgi:hypothetical protein
MPSFDVRPMVTLTNGNDVSLAANVSWQHKDNELSVRVADTCFKDGVSTNGLSLGVKNDRMQMIYYVVSYLKLHGTCICLICHIGYGSSKTWVSERAIEHTSNIVMMPLSCRLTTLLTSN